MDLQLFIYSQLFSFIRTQPRVNNSIKVIDKLLLSFLTPVWSESLLPDLANKNKNIILVS